MLKFNIMGRYDYNRIFISDSEQETIRNCRVFIGGAASGSVIAECALRLGFEKMTVAVNAIDITTESRSETNLAFDHVCESMNIPVIHPYNIGYASLAVVVKPGKPRLVTLKEEDKATEERFERSVVGYVDSYFDHKAMPKMWLDQLLWDTKDMVEDRLPEMSIAAWIAGGVCANLLYKLACGKFVKFFPNFYFYSAKDDMN